MPYEVERIVKRLLILVDHDPTSLPVPVERIARDRADIRYQSIPHRFDGITVKLRGQRPQIIINSDASPKRQRFTLAHELGHVIIPWHVGRIVDRTVGETPVARDYEYGKYESEANAFAAGLLLPVEAVTKHLTATRKQTVDQQIRGLAEHANVSLQFATVRTFSFLPPDVAYVIVQGSNTIVNFGFSPGSILRHIDFGDRDPRTLFSDCGIVAVIPQGGYSYVYYDLRSTFSYGVPDSTDWRASLKKIIADVHPHEIEIQKNVYQSINAVFGSFYGRHIKNKKLSYDQICTRLLQYTGARKNLAWLAGHAAFDAFVRAKALDFLNR